LKIQESWTTFVLIQLPLALLRLLVALLQVPRALAQVPQAWTVFGRVAGSMALAVLGAGMARVDSPRRRWSFRPQWVAASWWPTQDEGVKQRDP
jgi:hypothetical protein